MALLAYALPGTDGLGEEFDLGEALTENSQEGGLAAADVPLDGEDVRFGAGVEVFLFWRYHLSQNYKF